jgi:hypothetical protein
MYQSLSFELYGEPTTWSADINQRITDWSKTSLGVLLTSHSVVGLCSFGDSNLLMWRGTGMGYMCSICYIQS